MEEEASCQRQERKKTESSFPSVGKQGRLWRSNFQARPTFLPAAASLCARRLHPAVIKNFL